MGSRLRKLLDTYSGLDRGIHVLFIAQVVNSVGHFVHPFLTLFLTRKLGMGAVEASGYVLLSALAWVPSSLLGGKIADAVGRKKTMVVFHALPALALAPCAFLGASRLVAWLLIAASFLHGLAEPVNDAMVTDLTPPGRRKAAFNLLYLGHNIGAAIGPMLAGFLAVVVITLTTGVLHLTDRLTPALTIAASGLFYAAGFGMIGGLRSLPLFILSTFIWTLGEILGATSAGAYIANHTPMTHRARFNAVAPLIMWSGEALGPPLAGRLIERFSTAAVWPLACALSLAGSGLLGLICLLERRAASQVSPAGSSSASVMPSKE